MSFQNQRPSSRRDRRRGSDRKGDTQGADRTFFLFAGAFFLVALLLLAALVFFG